MENPSTPESNWGICLRDFWIERIMRCVPCIFCELRGRGVCGFMCVLCGVVLFPGRGVHCLRSCRISVLSMLRERVLLLFRELSIYTQTRRWRRAEKEEEGCILCILSWCTRTKIRMHFYKPAQANILVTLLDPHLNVTLCAQQKGII